MWLSEAGFWDLPLTPHKVRVEQGQKAERKHFKLHGRRTERAAAPPGEHGVQHLWQTAREGLTEPGGEGRDKKNQSLSHRRRSMKHEECAHAQKHK